MVSQPFWSEIECRFWSVCQELDMAFALYSMFLEEAVFFNIHFHETISRITSLIMFRATVPAATVINRVSKFGQVINRMLKMAGSCMLDYYHLRILR